jgi:N-acyl-phosphatidylethanolamine-hydrolysing phospholipase D
MMRGMLHRLAYTTLFALTACAPVQTPPDAGAAPPHRGKAGFQNNYIDFQPKGLADLLRWRWSALRDGLPPPPKQPTPRRAPDVAFVRANAAAGAAMQPAVTWIGHATVLAQFGGLNVLTDPMFSERASPLSLLGPKRHAPPGLALTQLPHVDVVLVSHNHYDHLDDDSVRALNAQPGGPPLFIVPLGLRAWLAERGITSAVELDWWQSHAVAAAGGAVEFALTPVQHWSGRSLTDRMETLWGGYAVFAPDFHLYFTGDTGYSRDFADIGQRYAPRQRVQDGGGFDLALIAIGAYEPRWFMASQHVNPAEAVQIHHDLRAKHSIGVHWGTFELTDEALDEPPLPHATATSRVRRPM